MSEVHAEDAISLTHANSEIDQLIQPTSPSQEPNEALDVRLSRKREREVSLEPATPKTAVIDMDSSPKDHKETRTPAKKNRVSLDTTAEEDDNAVQPRDTSHSPPQSASPPHEIKVRQISQGVEDITWRNKLAAPACVTPEAEPDALSDFDVTDNHADPMVSEDIALSPSAHTQVGGIDLPPPSNVSFQASAMEVHVEELTAVNGLPNGDDQLQSHSRRGSDSDSFEREKGLKRKLGDRAISLGPQDVIVAAKASAALDPVKNQETKNFTPPLESVSESNQASPSSSPPKFGGFMAYASTSSPFASVKGQNIFSSGKASSSPFSSVTSPPLTAVSPLSPGLGESSTVKPTDSGSSAKRTGFEAFSGSKSPFSRSKSPSASGSGLWPHRSKSPSRRAKPSSANAFSSYASGGVQAFAVPAPKRARAESPNGGSSRSSLERTSTLDTVGSNGQMEESGEDEQEDKQVTFGEKLRADKDDSDDCKSDEEQGKILLTEQEIATGEEDEETLHQVRGKLFSLSPENQWKERGTGTLKLNVQKADRSRPRLLMRKEAVYTVLLNATLFAGMRCFLSSDPRYLRFSVIEGGKATHYNLRVSNAKIAEELLEEIKTNIPPL